MKKKFREGRHADPIAECEAGCREHPADAELKRLCAMMHALVQNYARALELLQQLRQPGQENPDILFNIGQCQKEMQDFDAAARTFATYTQCFPDHPDGWASLADRHFQLAEFDEGLRMADRALALEPDAVPAWLVRGNCQRSLGRLQEALASYGKAHQIHPTAEGCYHTGLALAAANQPAAAIDSGARSREGTCMWASPSVQPARLRCHPSEEATAVPGGPGAGPAERRRGGLPLRLRQRLDVSARAQAHRAHRAR